MGSGSTGTDRAARLAEETFNDRYSGWVRDGKPAHPWQPLVPGAVSCWQCGQPEGSSHHQAAGQAAGDVEYDVRWVIDVTAPDPVSAAREALCIQRDADSWATVFIVTELGEPGAQWRVDLSEAEGGPEVLRTRETARLIAGTGLDTATGPGDPDAPARLQDLHTALGEARQALAGDSNGAGQESLRGLTVAVAAFLGDKTAGEPGASEPGGPRE